MEMKLGQMIRVTIKRALTRDSARKTLERLFMRDKAISGPVHRRQAGFKPLPKRRGGRIWTKHPNKLHPVLGKGTSARIRVTSQTIKDLESVASFVEVSAE